MLRPEPVTTVASLREQVALRLRNAILAGELAPGTRLAVNELAAAYAVSAQPVREALRQLERDGLVELQARRYTRVVEPDERTADEVYPLIVALEALAVEHAPRTADLDTLRTHNRALLDAHRSTDVIACLHADDGFHAALASRAGNATLDATLATLRARILMLESTYFRLGAGEQSAREHAQAIDALAAGDTSAAARILREHWRRGERLVRDQLARRAA